MVTCESYSVMVITIIGVIANIYGKEITLLFSLCLRTEPVHCKKKQLHSNINQLLKLMRMNKLHTKPEVFGTSAIVMSAFAHRHLLLCKEHFEVRFCMQPNPTCSFQVPVKPNQLNQNT